MENFWKVETHHWLQPIPEDARLRAQTQRNLGSPGSLERVLSKTSEIEGEVLYEPYKAVVEKTDSSLSPSGDFIWSGVFRNVDGPKLYLFLGDFEGHGYQASEGTLQLLSFLNRSFQQGRPKGESADAEKTLRWVDQNFRDRFISKGDTPEALGTLAMGVLVLDLDTGEGSYTGPMLSRAFLGKSSQSEKESFQLQTLDAGGLGVGGPSFANYSKFPEGADHFLLRSGDRLFFMTDGIAESRDAESGGFISESLEPMLSQKLSAYELIKKLKHQIDAQAFESQDDRTMVIIDWVGD